MQNIKKLVRSSLLSLGLEVSRTRNRDPFNQATYRKFCGPEILEKRPFFNVGAGSFYHPFWTNIDYVSDWYSGVQKNVVHHDLMSDAPLPIADAAAKIIYTSHTIEHVKENAVQRLFNEAFRALEAGGIFRITTGPDAETDFRALMRNDKDWFYWDEDYSRPGTYEHIYSAPATSVSLAERWIHHVATPLSKIDKSPSPVKLTEQQIWSAIDEKGFSGALDYFCSLVEFDPQRPGNHISWWTHDKVFQFLRNAGFTNIYRSGWNQSASPLLRNSNLFDSTHPQISMYVEAVK